MSESLLLSDNIISLLQLLRDKDGKKSYLAAEELFALNDKNILLPLIDILQNDPIDMKWRTVKLLGSLGEPAFQPVLQIFINGNVESREIATHILARLKDKRAVPALASTVKNQSEKNEVRNSAILALGEIRDTSVIPMLIQVLEDEGDSDNIRGESARTLGKIGDEQAYTPLVEMLNSKEHNEYVRHWAAFGLGYLGNSEAIDVLLPKLEDESLDVRCAAAEALGSLGDKRVINSLVLLRNSYTEETTTWGESVREIIDFAIDRLNQVSPIIYGGSPHDEYYNKPDPKSPKSNSK